MLGQTDTLRAVEAADITSVEQLFAAGKAKSFGFEVVVDDTSGRGQFLFDLLLFSTSASEESAETVGGAIDAFESLDIDIVLRQNDTVTDQPVSGNAHVRVADGPHIPGGDLIGSDWRMICSLRIEAPDGNVSLLSEIQGSGSSSVIIGHNLFSIFRCLDEDVGPCVHQMVLVFDFQQVEVQSHVDGSGPGLDDMM